MKSLRRNKNVVNKRFDNLCPHCNSKLLTIEEVIVCSGENLKYWKQEIDSYLLLNDNDRQNYLMGISNKDKFLDYVENGVPECILNNDLSMFSKKQKQMIADPIAVIRLERALKRILSDEEKEQDYVFNLEGKEFKLPMVEFPGDL